MKGFFAFKSLPSISSISSCLMKSKWNVINLLAFIASAWGCCVTNVFRWSPVIFTEHIHHQAHSVWSQAEHSIQTRKGRGGVIDIFWMNASINVTQNHWNKHFFINTLFSISSLEIDALGSCMLPFSNQTFSIILMTLFIQDLADNNRMPTAFAL